MKLFRRAAKTPTGRQRFKESGAQLGSAFSYHALRSEQDVSTGRQEPRPDRRAQTRPFWQFWSKRFVMAATLVVAIAVFVNVSVLLPSAKITLLDGASATNPLLRSNGAYQQAADAILTKSVWNRNKITVNTGALRAGLLKQFPEIDDASVSLPLFGHRPVVYLQPAQAALILNASNGSFVVDTRGKALLSASASASSTTSGLVQLTDQGGLTVKLNQQALTAQDVAFIQTIISQLKARGFSVASMTLPASASELDVQIAGKPYFVKFNLNNSDARQQAGTFLATVTQLGRQNVAPTQYVDVRVDGRAYYK